MADSHRQLKRLLYGAVPAAWAPQFEYNGCRIDSRANWRADVLAKKGTCIIALEAQTQDADIDRRSAAYLEAGVWPLWFFLQVPAHRKLQTIFSTDDVPRIPALLDGLATLADPKGLSWCDAQKQIQVVVASAGTCNIPVGYVPGGDPVAVRLPHDLIVMARALCRNNRLSEWLRNVVRRACGIPLDYQAGYDEGFRAGWSDAKVKWTEAMQKSGE